VVTIVDCPNTIEDYEMNSYAAALFGTAGCWMTQNLRSTKTSLGTNLTENGDPGTDTSLKYYWYPGQNASVAAGTADDILDSHPEYGLLYTWAAATDRTGINDNEGEGQSKAGNSEGIQGICPTGWHLPSDREWNELEKEIATNPGNYSSQTTAYTNASSYDYGGTTGWRPASSSSDNTCWGRQMKSTTAVNGYTNGTSKTRIEGGFDASLVGYLTSGSADLYGSNAFFWSSSSCNVTAAWRRTLASSGTQVDRDNGSKLVLRSVRCKKD
jgi:uncharacterized protein (TIGR02145 family)